jgi:hypothetical protein
MNMIKVSQYCNFQILVYTPGRSFEIDFFLVFCEIAN